MSNTKRGNPIFAVRLPAETQTAIREAAKQNGLGVAEWVANAVRMGLESPCTRVPQDAPGAASNAVDRATYQSDLDALSARVAALEALVEERLKRGTKPKAEPATVTKPAAKLVSTRGGARQPLSAEQKAQALELLSQGMGPTKVAQALGVDKSTVSRLGKKAVVRQGE